MILLYFDKHVPYFEVGAREILASFFMIAGFWYKDKNIVIEKFKPWLIIPLCAIIVGLGVEFWQCNMLQLTFEKSLPYAVTAIAGTIMVYALSKIWLPNDAIRKSLVYIGNNTLTILTWHFLTFKLVSIIIIWKYSLPVARLAEFPVIEEATYKLWWVVYFLAGVLIPIFLIYNPLMSFLKRN